MKSLVIPFIPQKKQLIEKLPFEPINIEPWNQSPAPSCKAGFNISHFNTGLYINYTITEPVLRAKKRRINGEVHKDNCVEFFIAFDNVSGYYNFEFNCLGSVKAAFGKGRQRRKYLPEKLLKTVEDNIVISMDNINGSKSVRWNISITLSLDVFYFHDIKLLGGLSCLANFAKCGDDLPVPHFLSWVNIDSPTPDFHQPSSFGNISFLEKELCISPAGLTQALLTP